MDARDPEVLQPASQLSIPIDGAAVEETSYITLLFDYRSVRNNL